MADVTNTPKSYLKSFFTPERGIQLYVFIFFLLACLFFSLQYIFSNEKYPITANICSLLASSFLVTSIFSVILTITDFINLTKKCLREIVIEHEYIKLLNADTLTELRSRIDTQRLGSIDSSDQQADLYDFLQSSNEQIFKMQYRRDFFDSYTYKYSNNPAYWIVSNKTEYKICCEHLKDDFTLPVVIECRMCYLEEGDIFSVIKPKCSISINNKTKDKEFSEFSAEAEHNNKDLIILKKCDGEKTVSLWYETIINKNHLNEKKHISVEVHARFPSLKNDNCLLIDMTCPTLSPRFNLTIQDLNKNYRIINKAYSQQIDKPPCNCSLQESNSATVHIDGWAFKGHGASFVWFGENMDMSEQK